MLDVEFQGTVSSRMVTFLSSTIQMSGRAEVLIKDGGTVAGTRNIEFGYARPFVSGT